MRWPIPLQYLLSPRHSPSQHHLRVRVDRPDRQKGLAPTKRRAPSTEHPNGPDPRRTPLRLPRLRYPAVVAGSGKSGHHRLDCRSAVVIVGGVVGRFPPVGKSKFDIRGRGVVGGDIIVGGKWRWWGTHAAKSQCGECIGPPPSPPSAESDENERRSRPEGNPVSMARSPMRPAIGQTPLIPLWDRDPPRLPPLQHGVLYRSLRIRQRRALLRIPRRRRLRRRVRTPRPTLDERFGQGPGRGRSRARLHRRGHAAGEFSRSGFEDLGEGVEGYAAGGLENGAVVVLDARGRRALCQLIAVDDDGGGTSRRAGGRDEWAMHVPDDETVLFLFSCTSLMSLADQRKQIPRL